MSDRNCRVFQCGIVSQEHWFTDNKENLPGNKALGAAANVAKRMGVHGVRVINMDTQTIEFEWNRERGVTFPQEDSAATRWFNSQVTPWK